MILLIKSNFIYFSLEPTPLINNDKHSIDYACGNTVKDENTHSSNEEITTKGVN
jgi:hypothetical protein